ncbi:hypothetical protein F0U61_42550 [Archangium violaceum]|uniref:hypothetical protein n=1 Tax=Archangium violaceum TaxID=83451 RepID=UPI002B2F2D37|nr:hypothetical protein F0U61_42550 [Archangium violaceum]
MAAENSSSLTCTGAKSVGNLVKKASPGPPSSGESCGAYGEAANPARMVAPVAHAVTSISDARANAPTRKGR